MNIPPMSPAEIVKLVKTAAVAAGYTAKGRIFYKRGNELTTVIGCYKLSLFDCIRVSTGVYPNALLADDPKIKTEVCPYKIYAEDMKDQPFHAVFRAISGPPIDEPPPVVSPTQLESACHELFAWTRLHFADEARFKHAITNNELWLENGRHDCRAIRDWAAGTFDPKNYRDWMR